jgi:hypothetical protein
MLLAATFAAVAGVAGATAQEPDPSAGLKVVRLQVQPTEITVQAGQQATFKLVALDAQGKAVNAPMRVGGARGGVQVGDGTITGLRAGSYEVIASVVLPPDAGREPPMVRIPVTVTWPAVTQLAVRAEPGNLAVGTTLGHSVTAKHADGTERPSPTAQWTSSDASVATVDRFGNVTGVKQGTVTITATLDRAKSDTRYSVGAFPATKLDITVSADRARTGDVIALGSRATNPSGAAVGDLPVTWSFTFVPDDSIRAPGAGGLLVDEKFVAEVPGVYTILASSGPITARKSIDVRPRDVIRQVEIRGHGSVSNVHTSDLWVYQGLDGRDYAVTGTWGGDGYAYFWDVTDPANIAKTDSLKVDARTVNDVKVSPDGRYGALSREGASNRRNGVVILDLANPAHPVVASVYDDGLTGGVHNMFATNDYLFALSGGDKYVILDVRDLKNPKYVSEYDHPDSRIHDVWVSDGIAYSSEWGTGVVIVDVGNGKWGGSIEKPKFVTAVPYPVGANHASFPYFQKSTGKFYLFLGDEIMPRGPGVAWNGAGLPAIPEKGGPPAATSGYYHIIDFTDPENPKDVARYEVKEFGTHNLWVEDDVLYSAYYEGGLRVVDVSGELLGNLANQGREIAVFKAFDPNGYVANAPMTWGPQPYKGNVFFSDFNSGLWSVRLLPKKRDVS